MPLCATCRTPVPEHAPHNCARMLAKAQRAMFTSDSPPQSALAAAWARGTACEWDVDTELMMVDAGCGRLEWFQEGLWLGCITRVELTPRGSRAFVFNESDCKDGAWVDGVLPAGCSEYGGAANFEAGMKEYLLLENVATLAEAAGVLQRLRRDDSSSPLSTPAPSSRSSSAVSTASSALSRTPSVATNYIRYNSYFPQCPVSSLFDPSGDASSSAQSTPPTTPRKAKKKSLFSCASSSEASPILGLGTAAPASPLAILSVSVARPDTGAVAAARAAGDLIAYTSTWMVAQCKRRPRLERFLNSEWQGAFSGITAKTGPNRYVMRPFLATADSDDHHCTRDAEVNADLYTQTMPAGRGDGLMDHLRKLRELASNCGVFSDLAAYDDTQRRHGLQNPVTQGIGAPDVDSMLDASMFTRSSVVWPLPQPLPASPEGSDGIGFVEEAEVEDTETSSSLPGMVPAAAESENCPEPSNPCCICLEGARNCVFFPCRHMCSCIGCGSEPTVIYCPMCRTKIVHRVEIWV